jgi:soluble lytic murein transglycosylase-like protein
MRLGPRLVVRGALLGSAFVTVLGYLVSSAVSLPTVVYAEAAPTQPPVQVVESPAAPSSAATQDTVPPAECQVSSRYPEEILQWCPIITEYATQYALPVNLVAALIWQESGGNPNAYSKSGAVGLMQVMPSDGISSTFSCANGPCFANRPTIAQLQDPQFNVAYGTRMLANLVKKYGDLREALRAYGPMNVGYSYADKVLSIYNNYGN